jgi:hypothetical protein
MCQQIIPEGLNQPQLNNYAHNFFGYGRWNSSVWLIGIEERGAKTAGEFAGRFNAWNQQPQQMRDLKQYYLGAFNENIPDGKEGWRNPTWKRLHDICQRVGFGHIGQLGPDNDNWGGDNGNTNNPVALIEAMPFPAPGQNTWPYNETHHELDNWRPFGIHTRTACADIFLQQRLNAIYHKLQNQEQKPRLILIYGKGYGDHDIHQKWTTLVNIHDQNINFERVEVGNRHFIIANKNWQGDNQGTVIICSPHLTRFIPQAFIDFLVEKITERLNNPLV